MIGLVPVELRRLFARRITLVTGLLLVAMVVLLTVFALFLSSTLGYDGGPGPSFGEFSRTGVPVAAFFSMLGAYLLSASFIAAEYASGSLATWLTFVPNRLAVFSSKLAATLVGSLAVGVLGLGLTLGVCLLFTGLAGGRMNGFGGALGASGRVLIMVVVAGVFGFCLASVTRNTGITVGLLLGYLVCAYVFNILMVAVDDLQYLQPWLPEQNVLAVIADGTSFFISRRGPDVTLELSFVQALTYWIVVVAVLVTVTGWLFRRRDVV